MSAAGTVETEWPTAPKTFTAMKFAIAVSVLLVFYALLLAIGTRHNP